MLQKAVQKSGANEDATPQLRYTPCTQWCRGVDLRQVQEYLGHSSLETTPILQIK
ncbi:MAG: tyrosine-type recombinase/integrase [Saprospiraceae bacterium]|nr:tyrosine-type recombinase/integrase [Saprospiraceae bacterium]